MATEHHEEDCSRAHGVGVALAVDPDGPLAGVLIIGASGAGKSALGLQLVESCPWRRARLVGDDVVILKAQGGAALMRAPEAISGLIELRGFGPAPIAARREAALCAVFDLSAPAHRLPEAGVFDAAGVGVPVWGLQRGPDNAGFVRTAIRAILAGQTP